MKSEILDDVLAAREAKKPAALVTDLSDGAQALIVDGKVKGDLDLTDAMLDGVRKALARDESPTIVADDRKIFIHVFIPPKRLVVVGAVHIAQALAPMAALAGYAVTIIDPRSAFAMDWRFPGVTLTHDWPDEALEALRPDRRTAVITLTHDPKLDDPALKLALKSDAFYIGALGSTRTNAKRLERLGADGISEVELARIHGPVGLDIGAISPAEIAIAILAEMTNALNASGKDKSQ
ncbi:MAG: XdhC family protein [Proteobacteria bacterium]|nr:XdhC family protein [Pseudomonadota bacterium]